MSQRRGPKQSPFIGKRVPLVDNGMHILYQRYVDPAEIVQGGGEVNKEAHEEEPRPKKRSKNKPASADVDDATTVPPEPNQTSTGDKGLANGGADNTPASKKDKKKKKRGLEGADKATDDVAAKQGVEGAGPAVTDIKHKKAKKGQQEAKPAADAEVVRAGAKELANGHGPEDENKASGGKKEKKKRKLEAAAAGESEEKASEQQEGDEEEPKKKKKKDKKKKKEEQEAAAAAAAAVEKKLTSGDANTEEAVVIRDLLGYQGQKALPVPAFSFQFPVQEVATPAEDPAEPAASPAPAKEDNTAQQSTYVHRRVYVGGMPYHWEEDNIQEYWSYCGEVESLDMLRFPDSGKFRGIAFITFKTQDGFKAALECDGEQLDGYTLKVDRCKAAALKKGQNKSTATQGGDAGQLQHEHQHPSNDETKRAPAKPDRPQHTSGPTKSPGYNVAYVGNIAFEATLDDLVALFKPYNGFVRLHTDKGSTQHKGYAHIQFPDEEALDRSLELDGYKLLSRKMRVSYGQPRKQ